VKIRQLGTIIGILLCFAVSSVNAQFLPTDIPGCRLWLDGDDPLDGLGLVEGPINVWKDKSGRNNDAVQNAVSRQPSFKLDLLNGRGGIVFDGTDDQFEMTVRDTTCRTLFLVLREADTEELHFFLGDSVSPYFYRGMDGKFWNGNAYPGILNGQTILDGVDVDGIYTKLPVSSFHQVAVVTNGSPFAFDNISQDTTGMAAGAKSWKGEMLEIIVYDTVLNQAQVESVEEYLHEKWFNNPPHACDDSYDIGMNQVLNVSNPGLLLNDVDYEEDSLKTLIVDDPEHGAVTLNNDGSFDYTPDVDWDGVDHFTYVASDGALDSNIATVSINVIEPENGVYAKVFGNSIYIPSDDGPAPSAENGTNFGKVGALKRHYFTICNTGSSVIDDVDVNFKQDGNIFTAYPIVGLPIPPNASLEFSIKASQPTADTDAVAIVGINGHKYVFNLFAAPLKDDPPKMSVSYNNEEVGNDTPPAALNGTDFGTVGTGSQVIHKFLIKNGGEETLEFTGSPIIKINGSSSNYFMVVDLESTTIESGNSAMFSIALRYENVNAPSSAQIVFTTNDPANPSYRINLAGKSKLNINPNKTPIAKDDRYTVSVNGKLNVATVGGILKNDADGDLGDILHAILVRGPEYGELKMSEDGSFMYSPDPNFRGVDTFFYKCSDSKTFSLTAVVSIRVNGAPVALDEEYLLIKDLVHLDIPAPGISANDYDLDSVAIYPFITMSPKHGTMTLQSNGGISYVPYVDFQGEDSFKYVQSDSMLPFPWRMKSNVATGTIRVIDTKNPPIAYRDTYTVKLNTPLNVPAAGVLVNDVDVDGNALYAELISDVSQGDLSFNSDGSFSYIPADGYLGDDQFTYRANDGAFYGNTTTVTLTVVDEDNLPPVAVDDFYSIMQDNILEVEVSDGVIVNDYDPEEAEMNVTIEDDPIGNVTLNPDGSFSYNPAPGFVGVDTFTYFVNDGSQDSNLPATVHINVTENEKPVAKDDLYAVAKDKVLNILPPGVLNNDYDPENDPMTVLLDHDVQHGSLTLNPDGSFLYDPDNTYLGNDAFSYKVNDGYHDSDIATVNLKVLAAGTNSPPVAQNDAYVAVSGVDLNVDMPHGVIANDYDPDQDLLSVSVSIPPTHGSLILNPNGSFTYKSNASFVGTDYFKYDLYDSAAHDFAIVAITVNLPTYSISGTLSGDVQQGVTVTVDDSHSAVTDASGNYVVADLVNGTYTVTPTLDGYSFSPASASVTINGADESGVDFTSASLYALTVVDGTGSGDYMAGTDVDIAATIPAGQVFDAWTGDVASVADVTAPNTTLTMPASDATVTATFKAPEYSISGTISGDVQVGVTISVDATHSAISDASGAYSISGLVDGTYTVTPDLAGYAFSPATASVSIKGADESGVDFTSSALYSLTVNNGIGSGDYADGAVVDISATIPAGQVFDKWTGDVSGVADVNDATTTFTMSAADATVTATFKTAPPNTYNVSGTVSGDVKQGVNVSIDATHSAITDASGAYVITNLSDGAYTVTPALAGYTFTPSTRSININGADEIGADFSAVADSPTTYSLTVNHGTGSGDYADGAVVPISADIPAGQVFDKWSGDVSGIADVNDATTTFTMSAADATVTAIFKTAPPNTYTISGTVSGDVNQGVNVSIDAMHSSITDASGAYSISGLADGAYTVTPTLAGYTFTPSTRSITINGANENGVDFTASSDSPTTYSLTVNHGTGSGDYADGAVVTISADIPAGQVFDKWTGDISGIADVNDATTTFTMSAADATVTAIFKTAPPNTYTISGTVSGDVKQGVTVSIDATHSSITDPSGDYTISGLADGAYSVIPALAGYTFTPATRSITINGANENGVDFSAVADAPTTYSLTVNHGTGSGDYADGAVVTISADIPAGQVFDKWTGDVSGVADLNDATTTFTMSAADATVTATFKTAPPTYRISGTLSGDVKQGVTVSVDASHYAITDASGDYAISGLADGAYTVTPALAGYSFTPATRSITINGANENGVDFVAANDTPTTYLLTVKHGTGSGDYADGAVVSISADIPAGQVFDKWTGDVSGVDNVNNAHTTLTMSDSDATVTATFKTAPPNTYTISGTVSGDVKQGVTVSVDAAHFAITNAAGDYTISGLVDADYTVTPLLDGYSFSPANRSITINDANENGVDFSAVADAPTTYSLTVNHGTGSGDYVDGAVVTISADTPIGQVFDVWTGDVAGVLDVNASHTTLTMSNSDATVTATFKLAPPNTYSISGNVSGDVQQGVTVSVDEGHSAITDAAGNYTISGLINDDYTVIPALNGYTFTPEHRLVTINSASENGVDFTNVESNHPPVAVDDDYSVATGIALVLATPGVLDNDTDIDTDDLTAVLVDDVTHGSLTLDHDGAFTYTSNDGFIGEDSFTYQANDGTASSNIATVTITVTPLKVTLGMTVSVKPSDVTGLPGLTFAKTPKIYGVVHSGGKDKKVTLKKDKSSTNILAKGLWSKKVPLYDKKAVKSGYNAYILSGAQKSQLVQLMVAGKTDTDKFKDLPACRVLLAVPEITTVALAGNTLTVHGNFFGTKAPKVALEPVAGGKLVKLKIDKKNYHFDPITGAGTLTASYKEGKVEPGNYYLVINNKIGIGVSYNAAGKEILPQVTIIH